MHTFYTINLDASSRSANDPPDAGIFMRSCMFRKIDGINCFDRYVSYLDDIWVDYDHYRNVVIDAACPLSFT